MGKKKRELRKKQFKEGMEWLVHSQMTRLLSEMPDQQCINFDSIRSILGDHIQDGVFAPGFFDYLRLGVRLIVTAFQPRKWHHAIFLGRP